MADGGSSLFVNSWFGALPKASERDTEMSCTLARWDYLIVTASNDAQAATYKEQLRIRRQLGFFPDVRETLVVADPGGMRVGSGGSTIYSLCQILGRELGSDVDRLDDPAAWEETLRKLSILIVHAGGDSKRLPAYSSCGKIFVPVPGKSDSSLGLTLFDRQLPTYLTLPRAAEGSGQVVITSGDVLLTFGPQSVRFSPRGVTGLGTCAVPERACQHGVYCADDAGQVRLFLQKPSPQEQRQAGAVDRYGQTVLDIGILQFDAPTAVTLMKAVQTRAGEDHPLNWSGRMGQGIETCGLDIYREVCCALGYETDEGRYMADVRSSGSRWDDELLQQLFQALNSTPFSVQVLPHCGFQHFGTTCQVLTSGMELLQTDRGISEFHSAVLINNEAADGSRIAGENAWIEGCQLSSDLTLQGQNLVVGVDVRRPLTLARGQCLDVIAGKSRHKQDIYFIKCYGIHDTFKDGINEGATFCNTPIGEWLAAAGARETDIWDNTIPADERNLWNARVFPAAKSSEEYPCWLWMFDPAEATPETKQGWLASDRYSLAEIATLANHEAFHARRQTIRLEEMRKSLRLLFLNASDFSVADLVETLASSRNRAAWVAEVLKEAQWHYNGEGLNAFVFSRVIHTLGSALSKLAGEEVMPLMDLVPGLDRAIEPGTRTWLESVGLGVGAITPAEEWSHRARRLAFKQCGEVIVSSGSHRAEPPVNALREDEIVWGRAPVRLDLGGGWSDTPPYCLESGGCVLNAAVNLNGQPPIHCYARVTKDPFIRIGSIDLGTRIQVTQLEDLLDYRSATSEFALAKATFALSGFSTEAAVWPEGTTLSQMLEHFGGGIELTTLAAIPKGSGLGTSSILGAVMLAVVSRVIGRSLTRKELFHGVLRLEQALTTGGGWQDQIGGAVDGVKIVSSEPGIVPEPRIHYELADVLDSKANGGATLLYYTGITRLAKNILQQVVGRYMNRDRVAMSALRQIHALPQQVAETMARKDLAAFGRFIDIAWQMNKQLDPNSTNEQIEALLKRVGPHLHGSKLLGAGGGGFLLMVCKSPADASAVRENLEAKPPNDRARFFDFEINREGLVVTVC